MARDFFSTPSLLWDPVFSGGSDGKESTCNLGDLSLIPWVGKIPQRRAWQPTPVFLPWIEKPGRLQSIRLHRVRHSTHACVHTHTYLAACCCACLVQFFLLL